jgi:hypothetical protein
MSASSDAAFRCYVTGQLVAVLSLCENAAAIREARCNECMFESFRPS